MKTLIIPTPGGYRIHMADHRRRQAEALGALASKFLQAQDSHLWARAADGEFLPMVRRGAKILRTIGLHSILDLTETEAHFAFMTCRFLAIQAEVLSARERRSLQQLLLMLARCCRVEVEPSLMSFIRVLPPRVRCPPRLMAAYGDLVQNLPISLALAARLWAALDQSGLNPNHLTDQLEEATLGFRTSLLQLRRTKKTLATP